MEPQPQVAPEKGRCHLRGSSLDERVAYFQAVRALERDFTDARVLRLGENAQTRDEFVERLLAELGHIDLDTYSRHMQSFHRQFPQFRSNSQRKRRHPRSGGARASTAEAAAAGCITRFSPGGASASMGIPEHPWTHATPLERSFWQIINWGMHDSSEEEGLLSRDWNC